MVPVCQISDFKIIFEWIRLDPPLAENMSKHIYFKPPFGALSKIGDQIQKYVVKDHGFPFLKWGGTSQLVQRFAC